MHFVDEARVEVRAGDGGDGCIGFRRESKVPRGGPDGGDGGDGGSVILVADPQRATLLDFKYRQHLRAERGQKGGGANKTGRCGEDMMVPVPVGTLVFDHETGDLLADLATPGMRFVVAAGGKGGRGNSRFATSTNQAPRKADNGTPGQERIVRFELKLLADVGLVGIPNAGKSTLISSISKARPKIADYPFTTLVPQLGVVELPSALPGERTFVVADLPGLIEGASAGAGLGTRFLRHIERTRAILHVVDASTPEETGRTPLGDFELILQELAAYDPSLIKRPQVVALNKIDVTGAADRAPALVAAFAARGVQALPISAVTGEGIRPLLEALWRIVAEGRPGAQAREPLLAP